MRECRNCKQKWELDMFPRDSRSKDNYGHICLNCCIRRNPAKKQSERGHKLKAKYNLSIDDYNRLAEAQNFKCAICDTLPVSKRLVVDHCHRTNKVRGLLCDFCNTAIGLLKDSPIIIDHASAYVRKHML